MNEVLYFIVKSLVSAAIVYAFYQLWLSKEATLVLNRFYLLTAALVCAVLPFIGTYYWDDVQVQFAASVFVSINLPEVTIGDGSVIQNDEALMFMNWALLGYWLGVFVLAFGLFLSIFRLVKLMSSTRSSKLLAHNVFIIDKGTPFSFMHKIFVPRHYLNHPALPSILEHENAHIKQYHSIDNLFIEILCSFLWFNPFMYLIRKSLREVHEYLADREVILSGTDPIVYQQVLLNEAVSNMQLSIANNFNFNLKKRVVMMLKKKNETKVKYRMAALPLLAIVTLLFCFLQPINSAPKADKDSKTGIVSSPDTLIKIKKSDSNDQENVFMVVEDPPVFVGGDEARMNYLVKNIEYPESARNKGIQGTVYVTFVIEADGSVSEVKILRGIGGGCDEEAVRVVKNMPAWRPGFQRGKPVRVQYNMPIKFTLSKKEEAK